MRLEQELIRLPIHHWTVAQLEQKAFTVAGLTGAVNEILPRLQSDEKPARFWQNRGDDGVAREKQLLIDFLSNASGGPVYYTGRDMKLTHKGRGISSDDWERFMGHIADSLEHLGLLETESNDVLGFIGSTKAEIAE